ncbi:MAG: hypothetical protein SO072_07935 [Dysosmobacter sp.]|nr:hypothetical protein [Dysosmobacter sp.]
MATQDFYFAPSCLWAHVTAGNVIGRHRDLLAIHIDFLPCGFRHDSRNGTLYQRCANDHASQQSDCCFLFAHPLVLLIVLVLQTQHTESTGRKLLKDTALSNFLRKQPILMHRHIPTTTLLFPMIILLVAMGDAFLPQLLTPFLADVGESLREQFQNLRPLG